MCNTAGEKTEFAFSLEVPHVCVPPPILCSAWKGNILCGNFSLSKALESFASHLETVAVTEKPGYAVKDSLLPKSPAGKLPTWLPMPHPEHPTCAPCAQECPLRSQVTSASRPPATLTAPPRGSSASLAWNVLQPFLGSRARDTYEATGQASCSTSVSRFD